MSRELSNVEVMDRVARFLATGDRRYLPSELRPEAEGIMATVVRELTRHRPWPGGAADIEPAPDAPFAEVFRALVGDDRADAPSGMLDDGEAS